jgi:hypothetical protein
MEAMGHPFPNPSRSVLDLLVEFQPIEPRALVQAYFGLEQQLAAITGKPVDLIEARQQFWRPSMPSALIGSFSDPWPSQAAARNAASLPRPLIQPILSRFGLLR